MEEGSDGQRDQMKEAQPQDAWTKRLPIFDLVVGKPSCGFVLVPLFLLLRQRKDFYSSEGWE